LFIQRIRYEKAISVIGLVFALGAGAVVHAAPVTTASGLIYESQVEGSGPSPKATDTVKVHYRGYFPDTGKEFDSSYARKQPIEFPLNGVIPAGPRACRR
jgi:FKBP-type peptidyl-prolyl cis-trans isomerase FkpA